MKIIKDGNKESPDSDTITFTGETPGAKDTLGDGRAINLQSATKVVIENIGTIGNYAFKIATGLTGLTSITIPIGVTTIGNHAFFGATSLESINIPNSVTTIGEGAFFGTTSLESITVDSNNTKFVSVDEVLFDIDKKILIQYPAGNRRSEYTILNSVTTIRYGAFAGATSLESIIIPNSVTTISNSAFFGAEGLTSIKIPTSVTTIGENAFLQSGLKTVYMGKTTLKNLGLKYGKDQQFFGVIVEIKPRISLLVIILIILGIIILLGSGVFIYKKYNKNKMIL